MWLFLFFFPPEPGRRGARAGAAKRPVRLRHRCRDVCGRGALRCTDSATAAPARGCDGGAARAHVERHGGPPHRSLDAQRCVVSAAATVTTAKTTARQHGGTSHSSSTCGARRLHHARQQQQQRFLASLSPLQRSSGAHYTSCEGAAACAAHLCVESVLPLPRLRVHVRVLAKGGATSAGAVFALRIPSSSCGALRSAVGEKYTEAMRTRVPSSAAPRSDDAFVSKERKSRWSLLLLLLAVA